MNNTFINPVLTKAAELGVGLYEDSEPVQLFPHAPAAETEVVIRAIYRQVLGNAHIMESERLTVAESQLSHGEITVREFVRQLAKSALYRALFWENCPTLRAIELNFKHLLGRAPHSYEEVVQHNQIWHQGGYEAEIDSYLDSEEYLENFGENIVPYYQGYKTQTGKNVIGFTHLFHLLRGSCSSDRSTFVGTRSRLQKALIDNHPSSIIPLSTVPADWAQTDVNQLLSKVLNLKTYQPVFSPTKPQPQEELIDPRRSIWQNQEKAWADSHPLELIPGSSEAEREIVIRAVYKQVLGNAHIMESERLTVAESQLKRGEISVREFVRRVAKSELYKSRFIDNCPRYRSHELNFKHLLGRAPDGYQETLYHSQILDSQGYEADIDDYIDSDEYQDAFGENIVPYYRGYKTQTGKRLLGYTNMFKLLESVSSSDKAVRSGNQARLIAPLLYDNPDGKVTFSDVGELLREVLKPQPQFRTTAPAVAAEIKLKQECDEQEREIAQLEAQLAELQSLATIGAAGVSKWQSYYIELAEPTTSPLSSPAGSQTRDSSPSLLQRNLAQKQRLAALQQQIAQERSLASIGSARLNKWRSRFFF